MDNQDYDVCIVGGAGHVGLPLALAFAASGQRVIIHDLNKAALEMIRSGTMPFVEYGAEPLLNKALLENRLLFSAEPHDITRAEHVIVAIGTPGDEYLNPKLRALLDLFKRLHPYLRPSQTIIIRSTVFPRTCRQVERVLSQDGQRWKVAYCPERIAQGYAIRELKELPQIVSGSSSEAVEAATRLFGTISPEIVQLEVEEAELAKLITNAWRYIQFAAANQFYMVASSIGIDFNRVRDAMVRGYGRAASLPSAGFAAGPCLLKDTMQLASFNNHFQLGHAAMAINEGLPNFVVDMISRRHHLSETRVGILGMAFKADVDDIRDSLSYKLGKILRFHGAQMFYSDEFARDPTFITKEELVAAVDVAIVGVPHSAYRTLVVPPGLDLVDVWGVVPAQTHVQV
ncbi:MAG: nucleotide sugar dehydrogenase [SAR202 cluster bacterium]|jgi:UDP-N-acetyl-D-mannosaminuronic acid dehydrogenase|nr:nucleotide sugar dehydrogenase [Acidobacteriota bacterium]MDP6419921.1 nucleotide sugar dehydrogenase [SAR202 cluster bacterium]HAL46185.1 nucleotide sugar dehydrogenase [Dehalococcoidia bacterium]MDP6663011.1 nucleotide sugar dehydrogenase [SAR202 cluster bacterium]MQG58412.1 nucleotide sugar dehydrogenase [SAR202 cluster bacterium]|tara:strand:- start:96 stop:1298 length:1203 start_codon:yes stop_codon:yes gene_type:complete